MTDAATYLQPLRWHRRGDGTYWARKPGVPFGSIVYAEAARVKVEQGPPWKGWVSINGQKVNVENWRFDSLKADMERLRKESGEKP